MPATLETLWWTPALTTPRAMTARSAEIGHYAYLMRQGDEWHALSDEDRRTVVRRLLFARWRLNPDDRLRHRTTKDRAMRSMWLNVVLVIAVAAAAIGAAAGWLWRWRP